LFETVRVRYRVRVKLANKLAECSANASIPDLSVRFMIIELKISTTVKLSVFLLQYRCLLCHYEGTYGAPSRLHKPP